ncbi:MAG: methionyl-tRNA formyltransferase [Synechococcus sp. SB0668_bin_15]|nr:methionyl-tRNA formyltransferase [Synechococcus sp. SB0668_bin_15]MXZ83465.1 methionyl-tRNA formyltransferase [Synechococcus sp. SB0666_bin_14]MYA91117.1 methionyl-tRNA formyltransferase [Synechococcus sp. SB0663_bin_10]MYC49231.1 methionyl-tRNA formyltransferase [Synechococcus sp. SB0662_bin_14]MYG46399.1 methionyl-tRNA formyltransferase [Synechococcus sp. SB0675_bin_6]MYJ59902.1 methionyl-tRNA formyltransferase [Synechococcus sp. SB0672_bin_6]MYK91960.1 methionyl-tRNA formyltransferase [
MRILFWGTPAYAVPCLDALVAAGHGLVGVVSQPDRRRGRGGRLQPSPVKRRAADLGLPVWTTQSLRQDTALQQQLAELAADVFVVVAFGQILPPEMLAQPRLGCWNGHGSLLPRWRGAAPIQRAVLAGDALTGVTIMAMEAGLDTGPVLLERGLPIGLCDTAATMAQCLSQLTAQLMVEAMALLAAGPVQPTPQPTAGVTMAAKLSKEELWLPWHEPALQLHRRVMAFYPRAVTRWQGQRLKVMATVPLLPERAEELGAMAGAPMMALAQTSWPSGQPGQVVAVAPGEGLVVFTGEGHLLLQEAQLAGKTPCRGPRLYQVLKAEVGQRLG